MKLMSWMQNLKLAYAPSRRTRTGAGRRPSVRPILEVLEDRLTPSTYLVSNLKDAGRGSLRLAVVNANNHAGPDTIVFKPGLEGTIKLTSGQIFITGALFLDGPGANKITIDGNQQDRIFFVSAPSAVKVTLEGLTLFNARTADSRGGAIFNSADLRLIGMVITGNTGTFGGGAIYNFNSNLTIQKSRIIGNTANYGGGIVAWGKTLIEDSTISGNQAKTETGGGIEVDFAGTSLTLRRSTVAGNLAAKDGGGIFANSTATSLIIQSSTIEGNHAGRWGGGVMTEAASSTITDTKLRYNRSEFDGGGIYASAFADKLIIQNSTMEGNQAGRWGGGVITAAASNSITDSRIRYNRSESTGGGLAANTPTAIKRSTISGNSSRTGPAGGISQYGGSLTLIDSTVSGNSALSHEGGGIYLAATTAASTIRRSTIAGNLAANGGGVSIVNLNAPVLIQNSTISGNVAEARGGGVAVSGASSAQRVTIQNSTIAFNRAGDSGGIVTGSPITLESSIVANNDALSNPDMMSFSGNQFFALKSSLISTVVDPAIYTSDDTNLFGVDPLLAPLANNGGHTQTHALKKGSPAINRGSNSAGLTTDQRGGLFKRLLGKAVDIGAFERE